MKLMQLGTNQTEVMFADGTIVFFSYETPVAARLPDGSFVRCEKKYSRTTQRHINAWLGDRKADKEVSELFFDRLVSGR